MESEAETVIIPVQDILGLGQECRMNVPGVGQGNWQWRLTFDQMSVDILEKTKLLSDRAVHSNKLENK